MANRLSQAALEAIYQTPAAQARLTQAALEVIEKIPTVSNRLTQAALEIVCTVPTTYPDFIATVTTVYTPAIVGDEAVPFITSVTTVTAPTLTGASTEVDVPFIASDTHVYGVFDLFEDRTGIGPGNGGETSLIRLAANGDSETATLVADITAAATGLKLTGDGSFPNANPFIVTIDDEILYIVPLGSGLYRVRGRGVSNTTAASHTSGATVTWGDSYDMAIVATDPIAHDFDADIDGSGSNTYPGWLVAFDSSQAYLDGDRYPMHVTELLGVFDAGSGSSSSNRCDATQPNAVSTPTGASDDCPAGLSNPSRIETDIDIGDVALVRYTNPETSVLDLGPRSAAIQSWFGLKRVDDSDADVTFTDSNGIVVDTTSGEGSFTGSIDGEFFDPIGPGIAPDTGEPTPNDVPYTTVTLAGTDRKFTFGSGGGGFDEKGWPFGVLCVRQGNRRVPFWESFDWHDFSYVYCGFGTDDTFAQIVVNRNGIVFGPEPTVDLPGPQDIAGPDAVWDDGTYHFAVAWYVAIFAGPYLVAGPVLGGVGGRLTGPSTPVVSFPPSGGGSSPGPPSVSVPPVIEGGSGGGIPSPNAAESLFQAASV